MLIQTKPSATTEKTDAEIVEALQAEVTSKSAEPRYKPGDIVDATDVSLVDRCQLLRPFGVVVSYNPFGDRLTALFVHQTGLGIPLDLLTTQVTLRSE